MTAVSESCRRLALLTEYDGSAFCGWQIQAGQRTVQQVLRDALIRLTGEQDLQLAGCSRTDAGVHARGHVSHFQTASRIPADRLHLALNSILPPDVTVRAACAVPADFHARFAARAKTYTYRIVNQPCRPAVGRAQLCHVPGRLDLEAMALALPALIGRQDFRAFRDAGGSNRTTIRTVQLVRLSVREPLITLTIRGDGFLYHMVRIIMGTLLAVGQGKIAAGQVAAILEAGDRSAAGKTMPPQGLCLEQVRYDPPLFADLVGLLEREGAGDVQFTLE